MAPRRRGTGEDFDGVEALLVLWTVDRPGMPATEVLPDSFGVTTSPRFPRRWRAHGGRVLALAASCDDEQPRRGPSRVDRLVAAYGIPSDWGGPDAA